MIHKREIGLLSAGVDGFDVLATGKILLCFQAEGILFSIMDLLKGDKKTLERAGRQSLRTLRDILSGPTDFVLNCLNAQCKSSLVMFLNLNGGLSEVPTGEWVVLVEVDAFCVEIK